MALTTTTLPTSKTSLPQPIPGGHPAYGRPGEYPSFEGYDASNRDPNYQLIEPQQVLHVPGAPDRTAEDPGYVYLYFDQQGLLLYVGMTTQDAPHKRWATHRSKGGVSSRRSGYWLKDVFTAVVIPTGSASQLEEALIIDRYPWWNLQGNTVNHRRRIYLLESMRLDQLLQLLPPLEEGWPRDSAYDFAAEPTLLELASFAQLSLTAAA